MFQDSLARLEGEVQSRELCVALFEFVDDAQRLEVVFESAEIAQAFVERVLTGVTERGVAKIVRQRRSPRSAIRSAVNARAIERAICATSSECVMRVRYRSPS